MSVPDLPADTRLCEDLPKCDITQWNDGKNILQSEELGSKLAIMHKDQNLCSALPFSNFKNCGFLAKNSQNYQVFFYLDSVSHSF